MAERRRAPFLQQDLLNLPEQVLVSAGSTRRRRRTQYEKMLRRQQELAMALAAHASNQECWWQRWTTYVTLEVAAVAPASRTQAYRHKTRLVKMLYLPFLLRSPTLFRAAADPVLDDSASGSIAALNSVLPRPHQHSPEILVGLSTSSAPPGGGQHRFGRAALQEVVLPAG